MEWLWDGCGTATGWLWDAYGSPSGCICCVPFVFLFGLLVDAYRAQMGCQWELYGTPRIFRLGAYGAHMGLIRNMYGTLVVDVFHGLYECL